MGNKTNNLVSVITPTFNSQAFIAETIESVRQQIYENWEMILVDDASGDDTVGVIKSFAEKDPRIRFFVNEINSGAAVTRNKALENARGRFIAFLDSDDLWYPEKLAFQINFMTKNNYPISFTSYALVQEDSTPTEKVIHSVPELDYKAHLKNTIIGMSTAMIDTDIVGTGFSFVNIRTRQDCYLWITLLKAGHKAYGIDKILAAYRMRSGSISSNKIKGARRVWYLYYDLEKLGFFKSLYYFSFYAFNAIKKRVTT